MARISEAQKAVHQLARDKGWWADCVDILTGKMVGLLIERKMPEKIALIHSEVSEALEAYRDGIFETRRVNGKPEGIGAELADVVIRVMDLCEALGIDLEYEISQKHDYNMTRPHRHGGKRC